jgi:hypothetical protein
MFMKKLLIALGLCLILIGALAVPAMAGKGAVKADIYKFPSGVPVGFAIFNTNGSDALNVEVHLNDGKPDKIMVVTASMRGDGGDIELMQTNGQGNGNDHLQFEIHPKPGAETIKVQVTIVGVVFLYSTGWVEVPLK